ncbi:MAG: hypothetical protein KDD32_01150 [Bacteroidetes bacterium]|nr:hypothetical protein [Bacteroidota bacterium]
MKKIKLFMLTAVVALGFGISSCGGDGAGGVGTQKCSDAAQAWVTAASNFTFNVGTDTEAECEAWKSAFNNFVNKCNVLDYISQEDYQDYLDQLDNFDCSDFN